MKTLMDILPGLITVFGFIGILMVALIIEEVIKHRKNKQTTRKYIQR